MKKPPAKKVKWEEMFPEELYDRIRKEPVCYLVYGLAEPHGPYNALGLDWLKAQALAERAARANGGVVAPPFCWHIQERPEFHDDGKGNGWLPGAGVKQPLCSSIPSDLFFRMVFHQIRDVDARGFKAAILITGHYGGVEITLRLICDYYARVTGSPLKLYAIADWESIRYKGLRGDHAGPTETSQLMELRPELVDLNRTSVPKALGKRYAGSTPILKGDIKPSRELGEKIVASQIKQLGRTAAKMLKSHKAKRGWKAPSQRDVEGIWHRFHEATGPYWKLTLEEYKQGRLRQFPGWKALGE